MTPEVLLALAGHVGGLVKESENGFVLDSAADFLSEAEWKLIEKVVQVGFFCKRLSDFTAAVRRRHFGASPLSEGEEGDDVQLAAFGVNARRADQRSDSASGDEFKGHYVYGMVLRIEVALRAYCGRVVDLEAQVLREPSLPLAYLGSAVEEDRRVLLVLHRLVERVKTGRVGGGPLLDLLWDVAASHMGAGAVYSCLWSLVEGAGQVLANQLVAWLVYGRLVDPDGEFFVGRAKDQQAPWSPGSALYGGAVDDFSSEIDAAVAQREWQGMFFLKQEAVPRTVITLEVARKVLFVGKAVRVLLRSRRWNSAGADREGITLESSLDPPELQEEVDALRCCFSAKSPTYVVQHSVERIRSSAALQLRQLVVGEAELAQHLAALKGFYLLGYGAFYQTFLEASRPLLQRSPSAQPNAEAELAHGPWAAALGEHEATTDAGGGGSGTPRSTASGVGRRVPLERLLASRFSIRFVPSQFEFQSFADAARQVKLVGTAHLRGGHAELGLGRGAGASGGPAVGSAAQSAMLWLNARQRLVHGFDHTFSFQVHAPPTAPVPPSTANSTQHGCRFALCFQSQWSPGAIQAQNYLSASGASTMGSGHDSLGDAGTAGRSGEGNPRRCPVWTSLGECLALEVTYWVQPVRGVNSQVAEVSLGLYVCHAGLGDGRRPPPVSSTVASSAGLASQPPAGPPVELLAGASLNTPAPRGMIHLVRTQYDASARQMQVFFGADATGPALTAEIDVAAALSLDLGCAYVGFCLLPLDHRHRVIGRAPIEPDGGSNAREVRFSVRDRPVSIVSWRHRARPSPTSVTGGADMGSATGSDAWFSSIELSYSVPWPLPLVITQHNLEQYNQLFRLLLAFRNAHLELQRVELPRQRLPAWALRAQLSFFVSQVLLYFQQDVIEVAHQRLLRVIEKSQDFDEVVAAHESFLATSASHCFLRAPDLHRALQSVLRIVATFCRFKFETVVRGSGGVAALVAGWSEAQAARRATSVAAAQSTELERMHMEFTFTARSILTMMASMHRQGMHAHLSQLLLRLDYNGYFSGKCVGDDAEESD